MRRIIATLPSGFEVIYQGIRLAPAVIVNVPVVVGGIIPPAEAEVLRAHAVAHVFIPKDFELTEIMNQIRPRR